MDKKRKKTSIDVMTSGGNQHKKSSSKNITLFNWFSWRIWVIGFLIPVLSFTFAPLRELVSDTEYNNLLVDIFSNIGIMMISIPMMLAAKFEIDAGGQIHGGQKTKFAFFLESLIIFVVIAGFFSYVIMLSVEVEKGRQLLLQFAVNVNIAFIIALFVLGTAAFFRRLLWKLS
jgi:hypothetical protein